MGSSSKKVDSVARSICQSFPRGSLDFYSEESRISKHECWLCHNNLTNNNGLRSWDDHHFNLWSTRNASQPIYVFVGPPTTGKSQAIKECAVNPMTAVTMENDSSNSVINKCTSSGLVKTIATNQKGYLLSPEIYDVLFKLLKSDEENATGDVQVLCQLFSGEATSYTYATENVRQIVQNTPFCVLGSTQVPFAARLVTLLDQGHGLLDRFLVTFPKCLRPTPLQTNQALEYLQQRPIRSCNDIFIEIARLHSTRTTYTLDREAREIVDLLNEEFIAEVNDAITEGRTPPKTKKVDIILRIAVSIHIFTHVTTELLNERQPGMPDGDVGKETLHRAINYVKWAESQKEIFVEVINASQY